MKQQWGKISEKVLAMSQRERLMVLGAMLAVVWALFDALLLTPVLKKQQLYRQEVAAKQDEVAKLQLQQVSIISAGQMDPDAGTKVRLKNLQQKVAKMDSELQVMQKELISPERMPTVLESVLQKDPRVKLTALATLPVSGLMDGMADARNAAVPAFGIYKHGFEVTLEGSYVDLMRYVTTLESSPWHLLWGNISLQAGTYPKSTLKLTLYTLSLDKAWLSI